MAKNYDEEVEEIEFDDDAIEEISEDEEEEVTGGGTTVYSRSVNLGSVSKTTYARTITITKGMGRTISSITTTTNSANCSFSRSAGNVTLTRKKAPGTCTGTVKYTGGAYYNFSISFK